MPSEWSSWVMIMKPERLASSSGVLAATAFASGFDEALELPVDVGASFATGAFSAVWAASPPPCWC